MNPDTLSFDIVLKSIPVTLSGSPFKLKELTGLQRDTYFNLQSKRITRDEDKKTSQMSNFLGFQSELLTLCLYGPEGKQVSAEVIDSWPAEVISSLFKAAQKLSKLVDDKEESAVKNG